MFGKFFVSSLGFRWGHPIRKRWRKMGGHYDPLIANLARVIFPLILAVALVYYGFFARLLSPPSMPELFGVVVIPLCLLAMEGVVFSRFRFDWGVAYLARKINADVGLLRAETNKAQKQVRALAFSYVYRLARTVISLEDQLEMDKKWRLDNPGVETHNNHPLDEDREFKDFLERARRDVGNALDYVKAYDLVEDDLELGQVYRKAAKGW